MVHVGAAFVADDQALEVVQPGEGALNDPAVGAMVSLAATIIGLTPRCQSNRRLLVAVVAAVSD